MVRIISDYSKHRPNDNDRNPLLDEDRPLFSDTGKSTLDDAIAILTSRPDETSDETPDETSGETSDETPDETSDEMSDEMSDESGRVRLPSVEEFHFEVTAARKLASKFAPAPKPRTKYRRPRTRYRSRSRIRWGAPDERDDWRDEDGWERARPIEAPRGKARGYFWSFCAAILIVTGASAAFGFVRPLNAVLPERMGAFLSNVSDGLSAGLFNYAGRSTDIEVAGDPAEPAKDVLIPAQPLASAVVARPVATTSIVAEVPPSASSGGFGMIEQGDWDSAAGEQISEAGVTIVERGAIESAVASPFASPVTSPDAAFVTSEIATIPDVGNDDNPPMPALQRSVKAEPQPLMSTPAMAEEPVLSVAPPALSPLSVVQIERLLARAEEFLQNGDIASARLLFLRVAETGDRRGAKGVGMTYDLRVYARLPVTGLTPDREQAEIWYKKAGEIPAFPIARNTIAEPRKLLETGSAEWNAACARRYISFDPNTGLYTAHSGVKRPCRLP